jgi:hypothetical protein
MNSNTHHPRFVLVMTVILKSGTNLIFCRKHDSASIESHELLMWESETSDKIQGQTSWGHWDLMKADIAFINFCVSRDLQRLETPFHISK